MRKFITLVFVSALGGLLTLGGYKLFIEDEKQPILVDQKQELPVFVPTNNTLNTINKTIASAPSFTETAEKSIDAVVHVKNTAIVDSPRSLEDLFFGRRSSRSSQRAQVGTGSGVIISPDGYIVTNNHVIDNATEIGITLNNNKSYIAELVGTDENTDIALLKIDVDDDLPFMAFGDSDTTKIGDWVLAVGNPFNLTSTVTAGIISAKARDLSGGQSFIQTDAAVNPGNSGGALVNTNGELVGINTAISSRTGSYVGYSFAVPSNIARKIVNDILEYGNVQNGVLGVQGESLDSEVSKKLNIETTEGFYVSEVLENTGADKAGILSGDIIKRIDNVDISKFSDLSGYLKTKNPNDVITVKIQRDNDILTLPVTLTKKEVVDTKFIGIQFKNIPQRLINEYDELSEGGVLIIENDNSYLRNKAGIKAGYVITKINDTKIESIQDINKLKDTYGTDEFFDNLYSIEYLDRNLDKKEIMFK